MLPSKIRWFKGCALKTASQETVGPIVIDKLFFNLLSFYAFVNKIALNNCVLLFATTFGFIESRQIILTIRLSHWSIPNETFRSSKPGHGCRWSQLQIVIISTDFLDSHSTEHHRVAANNFNKSKLISTNITSRVSRLWRHRKIATMRTVIGKTGNYKVFRERMYTVVRKYVDTLVDCIYISVNSTRLLLI